MRLVRFSALVAAFVSCFATLHGSSSTANADLVINLINDGGSAPTTTGTGSLESVMGSAAEVWELAFDGDSFNHTVDITYRWASLGGSTLGVHSLTGQSGTPNRETSALIRFDNDGSSSFFLDGSLFGSDPISNGNSEYGTYTEYTDDFGGGVMNRGRVFTAASGAALDQTDLFSVALHEIGHALGLSSANTSYQDETWPDNFVNVDPGFEFGGSLLPTTNNGVLGDSGFSSNAHLNINTALMYPSISKNIRRLPSSADILANAQLSQFSNPNLLLTSVPEPSTLAFLGVVFGAMAVRRRR